jgi:predicted phage baseplate assembly protein
MELFQGDTSVIAKLEKQLAQEDVKLDVSEKDLRLRRNCLKQVSEVWVRWNPKLTLTKCDPGDRCYMTDRARGKVMFGDGKTGRVPVNGASILGRVLQTGGGQVGNVAARTIKELRGVVPGIEAVFNPLPAEGGSDGEPLSDFTRRGPLSVRHRGRAVAPTDYATLAYEASSAVGYARTLPTHDPAGHVLPGWVTVLIIPRSVEPRPQPSFGLRQQVQQFIAQRAPAELADNQRIFVIGPEYLEIDVSAIIAPVTASEAGAVEQAASEVLRAFFHPLTGGPSGEGWDLGRSVFLSDVAAALKKVPGIDHVENLTLLLNGQPQGSSVTVRRDRIAVAGTINIQLTAPQREDYVHSSPKS